MSLGNTLILNGKYPLVSVVTVYFNRAARVRDSIQSLLDQSYKDIEILAVDDGSTDGTYEELARFSDPRLRVWRKENSGFTNSIKAAVPQTNGEFVAIHDSGDISFPGRIEAQVKRLLDQPETGVVGCWLECLDERLDRLTLRKMEKNRSLAAQVYLENPFTHGEVMFRRDVYERAGGYRSFFKFAQDLDLWVRMSRITDFDIVPEVLYRRVTFDDSVSASVDKLIQQQILAEFALQCGENVDSWGRDYLDIYGEAAGFRKRPSKRLSRKFAGKGVKWMRDGFVEEGWQFVKQANIECPTIHTRLKQLVCGFHRHPTLWKKLVLPALNAYAAR